MGKYVRKTPRYGVNPASEEELTRFTTASPQDVDAAVAAAQQARGKLEFDQS